MTPEPRCLSCGHPLPQGTGFSFHPACSRRLFGTPRPPMLARTWTELDALAKTAVLHRISVPGVPAPSSPCISKPDVRDVPRA